MLKIVGLIAKLTKSSVSLGKKLPMSLTKTTDQTRLTKGLKALKENPQALEEVILGDLSVQQLSQKHSISRRSVAKIKAGKLFADMLPHVRRPFAELDRNALDCRKCIHVRRVHVFAEDGVRGRSCDVWRCSLGLPDIETKGVSFAADCNAWMEDSSEPH